MPSLEPAPGQARRHGEAIRALALRSRAESVGRVALVLALFVHVVMFAWVVGGRLTYPFDLEWMTGAVLDHVERVRAGLPIYTAPSAGFIPFLYPPLYYWICALFGGTFLACRLVSLAAFTAQLVLAVRVARELGATRFWSFVGAGLVLACFSYVGWWYDLERSDGLLSALALGGGLVLLRARTVRSFALAGALLALACLAKQQAVFYAAGAGAGMLVAMRVGAASGRDLPTARKVAAFGATFLACLAALFAYAVHREGEWLLYYVLKMPRAHGVMLSLAADTFGRDFGLGFLLVGATVAAPVLLARLVRRARDEHAARTVTTGDLVFTGMLVFGFVGAVSSRLHIGGWINVLQPWSTFAAIAVAVTASRLEGAVGVPRVVLAGAPLLIALQLALWIYDPGSYCPTRASGPARRAVAAAILELEARGEVLAPATGHLTTPRHFHVSALADVARVEGHSPPDLVANLRNGAYVAILDGARLPEDPQRNPEWPPVLLEDFADLERPLLANYFVSTRLPDAAGAMALTPPNRAVWLYERRRVPLNDAPEAELRARQVAEMRLALERERAIESGRAAPFEARDIEELAAHAAHQASRR